MQRDDDWSIANSRRRARVENPDRAVCLCRSVRVPKETGRIAKESVIHWGRLFVAHSVRRPARIHQVKDLLQPRDDIAGFEELLPVFDADGQQWRKRICQQAGISDRREA